MASQLPNQALQPTANVRYSFAVRFAVHEPSLVCQTVLRNDNSQISQRFRSFERKSDLLANTRDNRRNCRLIHMLGDDSAYPLSRSSGGDPFCSRQLYRRTTRWLLKAHRRKMAWSP